MPSIVSSNGNHCHERMNRHLTVDDYLTFESCIESSQVHIDSLSIVKKVAEYLIEDSQKIVIELVS